MPKSKTGGFSLPEPLPERLCEVSWETANKVGGIYTVITSKAARMIERYGENYVLIGPYRSPAQLEQELESAPVPRLLDRVFENLKRENIICHYGRWKIKGSPPVILVDFGGVWPEGDDIKARLWEEYRIDSLGAAHDFTEPLIWAWAVGRLLLECRKAYPEERMVVHCHEWLSGAAILYLKKKQVAVGTVFTTHATVVGRALASNGVDIYRDPESLDADMLAYKVGVPAKHQLEKAVARLSDIFTTVSAMTADEAKHFLGRAPDYLLPNGLDIAVYPPIERQLALHEVEKAALRDFAAYFFFPYYRFNLEETLFFYTASRYEFRDKGIDVLVAALGRLNSFLKAEQPRKTVIVFFWIPAGNGGPLPELLSRRGAYFNLLRALRRDGYRWGPRELGEFLDRQPSALLSHLHFDTIRLLKEFGEARGMPPLATHFIPNPPDAILNSFRNHGLLNRAEDRVKVVFYPVYLIQGDEFLNLGYHKSLEAGHFGLYPSYYEPWGYTPLESAALGVSALTTDLTGFGRHLLREHGVHEKGYPGVFVLRRAGKSDEEVISSLTEILTRFVGWTRAERHRNAAHARKLSELADWRYFIRHYLEAHAAAVRAANRDDQSYS